MIKQSIKYKDFNGQECSDVLYFNMTRAEFLEHPELIEKLDEVQQMLSGEERELTAMEARTILELFKYIMRLSFGVRSGDGKRFEKSDDLWTEFIQTAAYDAFLFDMFEHPEKSVEFMKGLVPEQLRDQINDAQPASEDVPVAQVTKDPKDMTREELLEAFRTKNQG